MLKGVKRFKRRVKRALQSLLIIFGLWVGLSAGQTSVPAGINFETVLSYSVDGAITVHYALTNSGARPLVVDTEHLAVVYGDTKLPFTLRRSPAPGRANRLSLGETEHGTLTVANPPLDSDNVQLVWTVTEIAPTTHHTLLRTFGEMRLSPRADVGGLTVFKRHHGVSLSSQNVESTRLREAI